MCVYVCVCVCVCVWGGYKCEAVALESILLGGGKHILGCSSKTCNDLFLSLKVDKVDWLKDILDGKSSL